MPGCFETAYLSKRDLKLSIEMRFYQTHFQKDILSQQPEIDAHTLLQQVCSQLG